MKAATLILVFEKVNGHRTLSSLTSPRPTVKEGEKGGWQEHASPPALPLITCSVVEIIV